MELNKILYKKRVYFDTNIFIYLLEGNEQLSGAISQIQALISSDEIFILSSDLIYTEILPFHAKKGDLVAMSHIVEFLDKFTIAKITREIAIHAGIIRGETGMKTLDALHVASAIHCGSEIFLTNDFGIRVPESMSRIIISDYNVNI